MSLLRRTTTLAAAAVALALPLGGVGTAAAAIPTFPAPVSKAHVAKKHPRRACTARARRRHACAARFHSRRRVQHVRVRHQVSAAHRASQPQPAPQPAAVAPPATAGQSAPAAAAAVVACTNTDVMPTAGNVAVVNAATLCLVNNVRAQHGLPALREDAKLDASAQRHSNDMVAQDYFEHNGPSGDTPLSRMTDSGYIPNSQVGYEVGENIAWGTLQLATPSAIVTAWVNSPEHLANILNTDYVDTGMAVIAQAAPSLAQGQGGAMYTQDFGVITP